MSASHSPKPTRSAATDASTQEARLHQCVVKALEDMKARDVVEIDVREKTSVADTMFVVSGSSSRHVKAIADEVVKLAKQDGFAPLGVEGEREGEWILVDLGDIIVHAMLPRIREFYGLERLWSVGGERPLKLDTGADGADVDASEDDDDSEQA